MQTNQILNSITETMHVTSLTADLFYQQKNKEGFQKLDATLNILMQTLGEIISYQTVHNQKLIEEQILNAVLSEAMAAIEKRDTILLSDLLIFEINQLLGECSAQIQG